jgi:hippurate hydrolase
MDLLDDARSLRGELAGLRRALHARPEVGLDLPRTQERVLAALQPYPYEISTGISSTSVTAVLRGTHPDRPVTGAPAVLLRADLDALPVQEMTGLDFASGVDGVMHACGHDLHTAMLAGAAALLADHRAQLRGDVVLMFQPGKEMHDGAAAMIGEGVLEAAGRRADAAYGLHVFSGVQRNDVFCSRPGPMLAAADGLTVTVHGRGGHSSSPHLACDPIPVACEMVLALQAMVTRQFSIFDPIVVGVGAIHGGDAPNAIPETVRFAASVRSWSHESRRLFRQTAARLVRSIADAHGAVAEVEHIDGYPVTITDPAETAFAAGTVAELFGDGRYETLAHPLPGSEDFSRVLAEVPGTFIGLGATPPGLDPASAPFNHSPYAQYDDDVLPSGAALYAELAVRRLTQLAVPA